MPKSSSTCVSWFGGPSRRNETRDLWRGRPLTSYARVLQVAGESFTLMDGIIGLALSPVGTASRRLYFQPFASDRLFSVPTSALKAGPNLGDDSDLPVSLVGHKSSQAAPLAVDPKDGALVFSPITETALATWVPGSAEHG